MSVIIFHHNDADGRCAASIVAQKENKSQIRFVEMDYKDRVPTEILHESDTVYVVDFSFQPEIMREVRDRVSGLNPGRVVWCDHHVTAKGYGYDDLPGYRDFSDNGLSGCECTWEYCYPKSPVPYWLELLGDYDAWRLKYIPTTFEFYEGLKLFNQNPKNGIFNELLQNKIKSDQIVGAGQYAITYRDNYCSEISKSFGYETEILGVKAYAMNAYRFGSKGFGYKMQQYPVCIAYVHDGKKYTVSLYSESVDVSEIARRLGGGGHKGAAGFICTELPWAA